MKNKSKELPRIAVKFANVVFVLGILFSILLVVYAIYKTYKLPENVSIVFYIISMLCGGMFVALFGFGLKRLSNNLKVNLSILFFTVGIAVYGFETYLYFFLEEKPIVSQRKIIAKQMDISYDTRTVMEVTEDLRDSGVKAFPNICPCAFNISNGLTTKNGRIFPLGIISNSTVVLRNEGGYFPIVETDEHGFNNSKGLYIENNVDIVLTGDSFAEGVSVHSNETIGAVLRQLNFNAISVGKQGNSPLIELAALKEYAEPLKPKIVLWLFYGNDLLGLQGEMGSSILKKYLNEDDYSQNLISRQEEIDGVLIKYVQSEWEKEKKKKRIINRLKLNKLRRTLNLEHSFSYKPYTPTPVFRDVLQKSKQMVSKWNGKMYFVYLPGFERYSTGNEHVNRDFVMQMATELDIPIIDIHKEVFDPQSDPLSLFPFRVAGHYNAQGYRLVAEAIGRQLEADGYVSIKSKK